MTNLDNTNAKNLDKQNSSAQEKIDKISDEKNQTAQISPAKSQNTNAIFLGDKTPEQFFAQKCAVCHGKNGEKNSMLPTMRVMNKVSKDELFSVMKGYQNGVGGKLKATMLTQLNGLNDEQIKALAELIAGFGAK
ncbi:MAG: c-type cytochrome [Campylobacter sp.]